MQKKLEKALGHHQSGELDTAMKIYEGLLKDFPEHSQCLFLLGTLYNQNQDYEKSVPLLQKSLNFDPNHIGALNSIGVAYRRLKKYDQAKAALDKALILNPKSHDANYNLGNLYKDLRKYDYAIKYFEFALQIKNDFPHTHLNLGYIYEDSKNLELALQAYHKVILLDPKNTEAYINYANVLLKLNNYEKALSTYDQAIKINKNNYKAWANRGLVLKDLNRFNEALESFQNALHLEPKNIDIINNTSNMYKYLGKLKESHELLGLGLHLDPNNAKLHWNLSNLYLLQGNFENGFEEYEWRWKDEVVSLITGKRSLKEQLWLGDNPLDGKKILLYAEQGLGDTIQFSRYVPLFTHLGCQVILEVQAPLLPLFEHLSGVHQIVSRGDPLPAFDYQCPLMSLPLAFGTSQETIPPIQPITLSTEKITQWQSHLGPKIKPRIGLVWSGSTSHKDDRRRSIQLKDYLSFCTDDFEYFSLQKEVRENDIQDLQNSFIRHFENELNDFSDTAALISQLDLVISVDTSVAHLAASLNKPTLILIPYAPDWRWMLNRDDSPWYPTVKLYRQSTLGDWQPTLQTLFKDLLEIKPILLSNKHLS